MKVLFLVYHALVEHSGISKKILAQSDGLKESGADVSLCTLKIDGDGTKSRICNGTTIRTFGKGMAAKIRKRVSYGDIVEYVRDNAIELVYIRYDINADPFTCHFARTLHKLGVPILVEIPTWPYDGEFKGQSRKLKLQLAVDKLFRRSFFKYCDRVVTYSECETIFGRPTIRISNGIDFDKVRLSGSRKDTETLRLLSVANIHLWHGLDRLIAGMAGAKSVPAELHIIGDGLPEIIESYRKQAAEAGIQDRVVIMGPVFGDALDKEFDWANIAVGSLGRHRSGINVIKTLKNREYAARGLAFFYSETDSDFDNAEYVLKVPADESPVDIRSVKSFLESLDVQPAEIRSSVSHLSWKEQMKKVLTAVRTS